MNSLLLVAAGGALGALCRYLTGMFASAAFGPFFPMGTLIVNVLGCFVIGSVYARSEHLLREAALEVVQREALPGNRAACQVVPAALGDSLGDAAALSVALAALGQGEGFTFAPAAL